jgi:hypothetical protein
METTATISSMARGMGGELLVTLALTPNHIEEIKKLEHENLTVKIDKHRNKRSKDANSLLWAICREIGAVLHIPDREVYRKAIKDVGVYHQVPIPDERVDALRRHWEGQGIGWILEIEDKSKIPGYQRVRLYFGSSTYDSKEMSALLDYLIDDAEQMGLTLRASKAEIEEAKRRWGEDA